MELTILTNEIYWYLSLGGKALIILIDASIGEAIF